jgi:hypothetical protein
MTENRRIEHNAILRIPLLDLFVASVFVTVIMLQVSSFRALMPVDCVVS